MGGRGGAADGVSVGRGSVESRVRAAYDDLKRRPGEWIPLADVRDRLSDIPRDQLDAALRILAVKPGVHIIPWDNLKALTARDHAAALRFGGQMNHAIRIDR